MKKGLKSYFIVLVLGMALPFFLGLNCCCFAQNAGKSSCHAAAAKENCGHGAKSNPENSKCRCVTQAVLSSKESSPTPQVSILQVKCGTNFLHNTARINEYHARFLVRLPHDETLTGTSYIYLASIHAHAPPLC